MMQNEKAKLIISPDYDGFLALLYYQWKKPKTVFEGYYNGKTLETIKPYTQNKNEYIGLDLNCNLFAKCIDHHFLNKEFLDSNSEFINPNVMVKNFDLNNFTTKCPFSTILLLFLTDKGSRSLLRLWMLKKDFKNIAYILYADNYLYSIKKYKYNYFEWLKLFKMEELFYFILENYNVLIKKCSEIEKELQNENILFKKNNSNGFIQNIVDRKKIIVYFKKIFNLEFPFLEPTIIVDFETSRTSIEELKNKNILSHAIINKNIISVTYGGEH